MIPTESGWYWWRERPTDEWKAVHVVAYDVGGAVGFVHAVSQWDIGWTRADHFPAECWGPRIEDPPP